MTFPHRILALVAAILGGLALPAMAAGEAYPDPEQVASEISDPAKRAATFYILAKVINNHGLPQEAASKYSQALDKMDPPFPTEPHQQFVKQWYPLTQNPDFVYGTVKTYLPFMAARVRGELAESLKAQQESALTEKFRTAGILLLATMLAVPLLFLLFPWRVKGHKPKIADELAGAARFPDELRRAHVFRKSYPLAFECGQIFDINEWKETTSHTSTQGGRQYTIGDTTYYEPGQTVTTYSTTQYHRYWFLRPDGVKSWAIFADNVFLANVGNIISIVDAGGHILVAYNHTTGNYIRQKNSWSITNRYPGRWVLLATVLAIGFVTYGLKDYLAADYAREMPVNWNNSVVQAMLVFGIVAPIYIYLVKFIVQTIRNFQFRYKYEGRIRKFMAECTPSLSAYYTESPAVPTIGPA